MKVSNEAFQTSFKTRLILFNFNVWGELGIKPYEKLKQALKQHLSMSDFLCSFDTKLGFKVPIFYFLSN